LKFQLGLNYDKYQMSYRPQEESKTVKELQKNCTSTKKAYIARNVVQII
jgi:hypothetical protein